MSDETLEPQIKIRSRLGRTPRPERTTYRERAPSLKVQSRGRVGSGHLGVSPFELLYSSPKGEV
jgi:hypothetical protein